MIDTSDSSENESNLISEITKARFTKPSHTPDGHTNVPASGVTYYSCEFEEHRHPATWEVHRVSQGFETLDEAISRLHFCREKYPTYRWRVRKTIVAVAVEESVAYE